MSTTTIPGNNTNNGFVVVTHVVPSAATSSVPTVGGPTVTSVGHVNVPVSTPATLHKFLKVQPKVLGAVQIMTGLITLVFGIVLTVTYPPFSVYTGVSYWGSLIYISAGSLSVAAEKNLHPCLVKGSLGMNVISAITAGVAMILLSFDFFVEVQYNPCYYNFNYNYEACEAYTMLLNRTNGISGVLLAHAMLQFILSICISAFGCKATCCNAPQVSVITLPPNQGACCSMVNPFQTHSGQQDVFYITNPNVDTNRPATETPPAYSASNK